jgi:hypothetical protein
MIMRRPRCHHENGIYDFITRNLEFKRKILPSFSSSSRGKKEKAHETPWYHRGAFANDMVQRRHTIGCEKKSYSD